MKEKKIELAILEKDRETKRIENNIIKSLSYEEVVKEFVSKKQDMKLL